MAGHTGKVAGFIIGSIIGALAGAGTMSTIKKSQRSPELLQFAVIGGALILGIGGLMKGSQWDDEDMANHSKKQTSQVNTVKQTANVKTTASPKVFRKKKSTTSIQGGGSLPPKSSELEFKMSTESEMQGEYWVFTTTWTNPTTKESVRIITQRNVSGELITTYGDQIFYYGAVTASKENVARYHKNKVDEIVKRL